MASEIMEVVGEWVSAFVNCFKTIFEGLISIFYTQPSTSGGSGSLTLVGTLAMAGLGIGLVYFAYRVINKLIHLRG